MLAAKVFFLGLGFVQQVVLQRVLGAADFGVLALVLAQSNIPNNVIVAASVQGVSRAVAGAPGGAQSPSGRAALRGALAVHAPLALLFGGAFAFAAPFLAACEASPHPVHEVEDGFIRSVGLGADCVPPLSIIVDPTTARPDIENYGIDATYELKDNATDKTVLTGTTFARVSYDIPGQAQRFARSRGLRDAEDRAAKVIADNINQRLASFFIAGT